MSWTLIFCLVFISAIILLNVCAGIWQARKLSKLNLLSCTGKIISSGVEVGDSVIANGKSVGMFRPKVTYEYHVGGKAFETLHRFSVGCYQYITDFQHLGCG